MLKTKISARNRVNEIKEILTEMGCALDETGCASVVRRRRQTRRVRRRPVPTEEKADHSAERPSTDGPLFRSLVRPCWDCERIETTEQKAKEIRGYADRMITLGKRGDLDARRRALSFIRNKAVVSKLFSDVAGRFRDRNGGYTRMIKTRRRVGDAASMVAIELVTKSSDAARSNLTQLRAGKQGQAAPES